VDPVLVRDLLFGPLVYHWLATDGRRAPEAVLDLVWPLFAPDGISRARPGPAATR
ncbi:MAG: hypothetical protein HOV94_05775, partial [Saccharothrix sp.]|nr:hypothetical protein [Saccharothrix sp.]